MASNVSTMRVQTDVGPFAIVPRWVLRECDGHMLLAYCALADKADRNDGTAHPHVNTIAEEIGASYSTTQRALKRLRDVGAISWEQRRTTVGDLSANLYTVHQCPRVASPVTEPLVTSAATLTHQRPDVPAPTPEKKEPKPVTQNQGPEPGTTLPSPASQTPAARKRDPIWDTLLDACGIDLTAKLPRGTASNYGKLVRDLKEIGASPEQIAAKARIYRKQWPNVSLTPNALVKRWAELNLENALTESERWVLENTEAFNA